MEEGSLPSEEEIQQGEKAVDILQQLSDVLLENLDINRQNVDAIKDSVLAAGDLAAPFVVTREAQKSINKAFRQSASMNADINATLKERLTLERDSKSINKDLDKGKSIQKKLLLEQAEITKKISIARKLGLAEGSAEIQSLKDVRAGLNSQVDIQSDINAQLDKESNSVKKIDKAFGLTGKSLKVIDNLLGSSIGDLDEIQKATKKRLALLEKEGKLQDGIGGKMQGFGIQVSEVGKSIMKNLNDPLTYLKAGLDFDAEATKLQKNLAISGTEAYKLNATLSLAATNTGNFAIQGKDAAKAFGTLNDQIGIASDGLVGMAGEAAKMQKLLGLSDEAIGRAGKASLITGKSMEDIKLDIIDQTTSVRTQTGIALDYNKILAKTLNVSGQIAMQLGNNPKKIAEAVAQANALGMELEQVAKVGQSLLNFEQSIEAELEAELLTGKELNLEKARLLALTGDYAALSTEIAEQAGSFTEYSAMNVIQQQKLAQAFGMSADEMSNMLIDQEAMGKTAEQLRAEGKEDIAQRLEARNAQEKFTDAVEKMKSIFTDLVGGPVGGLLNMLTLALIPINAMVTSVSKIFSLFTDAKSEMSLVEGIMGTMAITAGVLYTLGKKTAIINKVNKGLEMGRSVISSITLGYQTAKNALMIKENALSAAGLMRSIGGAMMDAIKSLSKIPVIGPILGIAAAGTIAAMGAKYLSKADDGIFEGGGYGKRALMDEGSITLFNDKDTIVAGTNLNKADDMVSAPAGTVQTSPSPAPAQPVILQNEVVYDSHQSANYYNGPRSTEKSETGIHA